MKTHITFPALSLLALVLLVPVFALAAEIRAGEQPSTSASERIAGDLYMAGGNVSSHGPITGDLVLGGGNIVVDGSVSQDLIVGGGNINILTNIGDDVRAGGGTIVINGSVRGDVVVGGGQTHISGAGVGGDVVWGGGMLRIDAPVAGDLTLAGGEVTIDSVVRGNVQFRGEKLTLGKNAVIEGNLTYKSPKEATLEAGAVVNGTTNYEPRKSARDMKNIGLAALISLAVVTKFFSLLACALIVGLLLRRYMTETLHIVTSRPLIEMGRGLIVLIVLPIVSIMVLVSIIGIPFGILGLLSFAAIIIFASIIAPIILGSIVHKSVFKTAGYEVSWKTILSGVLLYMLLGLVPFIGWIAKFLLVLLAVGSMAKIKWDVLKEWR